MKNSADAKNVSGSCASRSLLSVFAAVLLLCGCGGPKIIPDRELARIFHDIYLVNAYVNQSNPGLDSLNIYEPVFAAHGYTSEDMQYTIGNFAKRKSARLSDDVVEVARQMLQTEAQGYSYRISLVDTVARRAHRQFARRVYTGDEIRVRRAADTGRLSIVIPDLSPGEYEISYRYYIDSTDRNAPLRTESYIVDSKGKRSGLTSRRLAAADSGRITVLHTARQGDRRLVLALNGYPRNLTRPSLAVDCLRVTHYLPREEAVGRLRRTWYGRGMLDTLLTPDFESSESNETPLFAPLVDTMRTRSR